MPTIESKVYAATLGSGAGTILSGFLLWVLGVTAWHSDNAAGNAVAAASAVPAPVAALVTLLLAIGGTFLGGYVAPHTPRPDLTAGNTTMGVPKMAAAPAVPLLEHFPAATGAPEPVAPAPAPVVPVPPA
jgi:hypothetical protein